MAKQYQLPYNRWSAVSLFTLSLVIISLQLMLMRSLSVSYYYHFAYLVISTALLGFGASGTLLSLTIDRLKQRFSFWVLLLYILFVVSIPLCYLASQQLSLDVRYLLYSVRQFFMLILMNLLLFIPFFIGALLIGLKLSYFKKKVPELYGANLIGSGVGGVLALGIMYLAPAHLLPLKLTPIAFLALICWLFAGRNKWRKQPITIMLIAITGIIALGTLRIQPDPLIDQYKDLSHFKRLEQQGDANHVVQSFGPRAQIDIYSSSTIHNTMFAGLQADTIPPQQLAILMDGHASGTIFSIDRNRSARILDFTPQSLPYRLVDNPDVLLLGEVGGTNVWLAERFGAEQITVVQNNPQLVGLMKEDLKKLSGEVYLKNNVEVINKHPRLFLEQTNRQFDIIQFVTAEGMGAGSGGLQGLSENYLLTTNAVTQSLNRLTKKGVTSITRGIQSPPRDNIKIFAMAANALRNSGVEKPGKRLLISRNYLAVNTIISESDITDSTFTRYLNETDALGLDREYYPGILSSRIEQNNRLDGPEGTSYSYLHHALLQILSENPSDFYEDWVYEVRAPTDNKPYFYDFFKWDVLDRFQETYGSQWFRKLELGYVILVFTFVELFVIAFFLILLPLIISRRAYKETENKLPTFLHFAAIGVGFMLLEITFIQIFTKFLGDPIFSAAAILTSILVFSGIGSQMQKKAGGSPEGRIRTASAVVAGMVILYLLFLDPVLTRLVDHSTAFRFIIAVIFLMPVSFFMGWLFPTGIQKINQNEDELVPWAWGINGFASVTASPLAVMLAMSFGFKLVMILAAVCYVVTIPVSLLWKKQGE